MGIDSYIGAVIEREGGYTNNPADSGGETIWGITSAVARAYGYAGPMKNMPRDVAVSIYRNRYWTSPRLDQVDAIDPALAEKLFDVGVNMGPATGIAFLQRALNVLNLRGTTFIDLVVDGAIGPMTVAALNAFYGARGPEGRQVVLGMVRAQQSVRYVELAERNPDLELFEYGWQLNRALGVV